MKVRESLNYGIQGEYGYFVRCWFDAKLRNRHVT